MRNSESVFFLRVRACGRPDGALTQALCRAHRATKPVRRIFWPRVGGREKPREKHASFLNPPRKSANVEGHPIGSGERPAALPQQDSLIARSAGSLLR